MWHRRMWTNVSGVCCCLCTWHSRYLASVSRWLRHKEMAGKLVTADIVSNCISSCGDVDYTTDGVWLRWKWTKMRFFAWLHSTTSRYGGTNWNIGCQSHQHKSESASGQYSLHWRSVGASVHRFSSTTIGLHSTHGCWLTMGKHNSSGSWQSTYCAAQW